MTCCCYCCSCCYCYICNKAVTKLHFGVVVSRLRQVTSHVPASATRRSQVTFLSCGCLAGPGHESRSCIGDKAVTKSRLQLWFLGWVRSRVTFLHRRQGGHKVTLAVVVSRLSQVTSHVPASATRRSQSHVCSCGFSAEPGHESRSCVGDKAVTKSRLQLWFLG